MSSMFFAQVPALSYFALVIGSKESCLSCFNGKVVSTPTFVVVPIMGFSSLANMQNAFQCAHRFSVPVFHLQQPLFKMSGASIRPCKQVL